MNKTILLVLQLILGIALTAVIIIQSKGSGLGSAFSGAFNTYSTKRGVEKVVFQLTIFLAALFFISSIVQLLI